MVLGSLSSHVTKVGVDPTNLGRWSWMMVEGANGHRTRIVVAYQPSSHNLNKPTRLLTVYRQQANFFLNSQKDKTCPRKLFWDHLISALAT